MVYRLNARSVCDTTAPLQRQVPLVALYRSYAFTFLLPDLPLTGLFFFSSLTQARATFYSTCATTQNAEEKIRFSRFYVGKSVKNVKT